MLPKLRRYLMCFLMGLITGCRSEDKAQTMRITSEVLDGGAVVVTVSGFARAYSIGVDTAGVIYVPDMPAHNVVVINPDFRVRGAFDIQAGRWQPVSVPGKRIHREPPHEGLVAPHSVSFDIDGAMYVTEFKGNRVSKISPDGALVARIGSGILVNPVVSYVETDGFLYVGSYGSDQIVRFTTMGEFQGWLGETTDKRIPSGWRVDGKPQRSSALGGLNRPHAARVGPDGSLYVVDTGNHRIVKYDGKGAFVGWTGVRADGGATDGWTREGAARASGELGGFNAPIELEIDSAGMIYVTDCYNNRIVRLNADGRVTGWMGSRRGGAKNFQWHAEGEAEASNEPNGFNQPYGLRIRNSLLYVADTNNQRILIIDAPSLGIR